MKLVFGDHELGCQVPERCPSRRLGYAVHGQWLSLPCRGERVGSWAEKVAFGPVVAHIARHWTYPVVRWLCSNTLFQLQHLLSSLAPVCEYAVCYVEFVFITQCAKHTSLGQVLGAGQQSCPHWMQGAPAPNDPGGTPACNPCVGALVVLLISCHPLLYVYQSLPFKNHKLLGSPILLMNLLAHPFIPTLPFITLQYSKQTVYCIPQMGTLVPAVLDARLLCLRPSVGGQVVSGNC